MQINRIRYLFGHWDTITYSEDGDTHTIKERDKTWKTFLELYPTEIAEYDNCHKIRKRISRFTAFLLFAFFIYLFVAIPFSFIYDMNVTAIWVYPLYSLLDTLSDDFRYSSQFFRIIFIPVIILGIIIAVVVGIINLLKNREKHLIRKIIFPALGIALLVILFKYVIPSMTKEFQAIYYKKENSIVIKSDQIQRRSTGGGTKGRGYNFTARTRDSANNFLRFDFTSYQYYKIRDANDEQNGRSIRVHYLESSHPRKYVFAYELVEE